MSEEIFALSLFFFSYSIVPRIEFILMFAIKYRTLVGIVLLVISYAKQYTRAPIERVLLIRIYTCGFG